MIEEQRNARDVDVDVDVDVELELIALVLSSATIVDAASAPPLAPRSSCHSRVRSHSLSDASPLAPREIDSGDIGDIGDICDTDIGLGVVNGDDCDSAVVATMLGIDTCSLPELFISVSSVNAGLNAGEAGESGADNGDKAGDTDDDEDADTGDNGDVTGDKEGDFLANGGLAILTWSCWSCWSCWGGRTVRIRPHAIVAPPLLVTVA